jgi:hypothetical protein
VYLLSMLTMCHSRSCMWPNRSYVFWRHFVLMTCEESLDSTSPQCYYHCP